MNNRGVLRAFALSLAIAALSGGAASAQQGTIPFSADRWELSNAMLADHLGRPSLMGTATLKDVSFDDGVIEVDMAVSGKTSYPGIVFRMEGEGAFERIYFRPHRAGLYPDAVQYTPTMNGIEEWQLCNGPGFTGRVELPRDEWIHVRLEVKGTQARVFVNGAEQPCLVVHELRRGRTKGTIGLSGPADKSAYFSNFSYRGDSGLRFEAAPLADAAPGAILEWEISPSIKGGSLDMDMTPAAQGLGTIEWRPVTAEPSGLVDLGRYVMRNSAEPDVVFARAAIPSERAETRKLELGYSDAVSVFLNGKLLFTGNSAYRYRDPTFLGIAGYYDAVSLPLEKGRNELLLAVAEGMGGWGYMCRFGDAEFAGAGVKKLWETPRTLRVPESAAYDPERRCIYVSNFDGYNRGVMGAQSVAKLSLDGTIEDPNWIGGLTNPTGLAVVKDTLYAVLRRSLVAVNLGTRRIARQIFLPQPVVPNDVAVAGDGTIYVSDSARNLIYRIRGERVEEWLSAGELALVNGLCWIDGKLVAGAGAEPTLYFIDPVTKEMKPVARWRTGQIDGIASDGRGNVLLSLFDGKIFRVTPAGEVSKLVDTSVRGMICADFCYVPEKNLLVAPRAYYNSVAAYEIR